LSERSETKRRINRAAPAPAGATRFVSSLRSSLNDQTHTPRGSLSERSETKRRINRTTPAPAERTRFVSSLRSSLNDQTLPRLRNGRRAQIGRA